MWEEHPFCLVCTPHVDNMGQLDIQVYIKFPDLSSQGLLELGLSFILTRNL